MFIFWCICFYFTTTAYVFITWPRISAALTEVGIFMVNNRKNLEGEDDDDKRSVSILEGIFGIAEEHGYSPVQFIIMLILVVINKPFTTLFNK